MSESNHHFFFEPNPVHPFTSGPTKMLAVHVLLDEHFADSLSDLISNGLVVDELVIRMHGRAYADPLLMTVLANDNPMPLDNLDKQSSTEEVKIDLHVSRDNTDGKKVMQFRLMDRETELASKTFPVLTFIEHLRAQHAFDASSQILFDGILRSDSV